MFVQLTDILETKVDAIVNAANERLCHAGGIAGVIARAAGRELCIHAEEYIARRGKVKTGNCMASPAFGL